MSKIQKNAQPKKPLGGGEKAEAKGNNRILYILLCVLVGVFIWKVADQGDETNSISKENSNSADLLFDKKGEADIPNPNVEVEIVEADLTNTEAAVEKETAEANIEVAVEEVVHGTETETKAPVVEEETSYTINADVDSEPVSSTYQDYSNNTSNDYGYIYAASVDVPQGSFNGLDNNGFAQVNNTVDINVAVSQFDGSTGRLVEVPDNQLNSNYYNNEPEILPTFNPPVEREVTYATNVDNRDNDAERFPTTGVDYGTVAYPLKDTLPWHPYESLAYIREEKEVFVAEKVRNMPTADDLEPNIPPSTLGDRDTRMGFGVVIRPNR